MSEKIGFCNGAFIRKNIRSKIPTLVARKGSGPRTEPGKVEQPKPKRPTHATRMAIEPVVFPAIV